MNIINDTQSWRPFFNTQNIELNRGFPLEENIRIATMIRKIRTFMLRTHTTNRSCMFFARFIYNQLRDEGAEIKVIWAVIAPNREIVHQIVEYRGHIIEPNPMFYAQAARGYVYTEYPTTLGGFEDLSQTCFWDNPIDSWERLMFYVSLHYYVNDNAELPPNVINAVRNYSYTRFAQGRTIDTENPRENEEYSRCLFITCVRNYLYQAPNSMRYFMRFRR